MKSFSKKLKTKMKKNIPMFIILLLIIILAILFFANHIFIFIEPGEAAVLWSRFSGGTKIDRVYEEGFHTILPWDKVYRYNIRNQEVKDSVEVLTVNGLSIRLDLSIRYHPQKEILGLLHKTVGPNYLNVVIIPEIESVVRTIIGQYTPEEIYTAQKAIVERIVSESYLQVEERYIVLDAVLVKKITLPSTIKHAIETKLQQEQLAQEYDFRIEKERKESIRKKIEAEGIQDYNRIVRSELNNDLLKWQGIEATKELAKSENSKIIIIGTDSDELPIMLGK